jgi:5-methylthioadenosine/S-adenosylhomocysteine deaminase
VLGSRKFDKTLTAPIDGFGLIDSNFSAAHGIWLVGDDLDRIAAKGGSIVRSPMSTMRFGSGLARPARTSTTVRSPTSLGRSSSRSTALRSLR